MMRIYGKFKFLTLICALSVFMPAASAQISITGPKTHNPFVKIKGFAKTSYKIS